MPQFTKYLPANWRLSLTLGWMLVLVLPYAVVGETWGMVWYLLTYPLSEWLKFLWDWNVVLYVAIVTISHGLLVLGLIHGGRWFFDRMTVGRTRNQEGGEAAQEGDAPGALLLDPGDQSGAG